MRHIVVVFIGLFFLLTGPLGCAQVGQEGAAGKDRQPAVAGQFYPASASALKRQLENFFAANRQVEEKKGVAALVAPHAGYRYSGQVAAAAYSQVPAGKAYDNVFILAPSHHHSFDGVSIYHPGDYLTPLGRVQVNQTLADKLIKNNEFIDYHPRAHTKEHSLEVQLPFLQYRLNENLRIVPILTGTHDPQILRRLANVLAPYFNEDNLFVVSTDFSHFPPSQEARQVDAATANAVCKNKPDAFLNAIRSNAQRSIPQLATSMCGWPGMYCLLNMTSTEGRNIRIQKLLYRNSGDVTGDSSRVVGYWAMGFTRNKNTESQNDMGFQLNQQDKQALLRIARQTLNGYVREGKVSEVDESNITETMQVHTGAFVTLTINGELRGCIGRFDAEMPLYQVVQEMAVAASSQDARFPPVSEEELDEINIEISVLTPMEKISSPEEIELGEDGIYIKKGPLTGTLLPQVAEKTGWTKEEFLGHCARDKAGIGWDGWKDEETELYTYQAIVFHEGST